MHPMLAIPSSVNTARLTILLLMTWVTIAARGWWSGEEEAGLNQTMRPTVGVIMTWAIRRAAGLWRCWPTSQSFGDCG